MEKRAKEPQGCDSVVVLGAMVTALLTTRCLLKPSSGQKLLEEWRTALQQTYVGAKNVRQIQEELLQGDAAVHPKETLRNCAAHRQFLHQSIHNVSAGRLSDIWRMPLATNYLQSCGQDKKWSVLHGALLRSALVRRWSWTTSLLVTHSVSKDLWEPF